MKINYILIFIIFYGCSSFNKNCINNNLTKNINDSVAKKLSFELCEIYGFDQGIRTEGLKLENKSIREMDSINFFRIITFIRKNGFPNEKLLGKENFSHECVVGASFAVLLHNPQRVVKNRDIFNFLIKEVDKGNMTKEYLALILDKYYLAKKGNNMRLFYGTQFGKPCFEDKKISDSLRKEIKLQPLKDNEYKKCNKL
ncbi:hypothetical protein KRE47_12300 [Elizabethkingia meningoseptica]|uniref:hypothetical protein n=1 Tax=Elizabethkingia meningoseptica TaxID=238 RepID=UPI0022F177D4|nr:hypothetical protein [Elizabethkingia meningoseptica]EJK5329194.1 hypothetical protein [Elizabethkingia meningoseptica]MDE5468917.1 hypothetical protein [Elizabethkingia meningoseptica]MDE5476231.1 hypothetical protein [Elizabethkingia meningoseptica]MDE5479165.1 hypothetical protein [Elizabethkingia meningoseptica]MDE5485113.1 hypothetical protein [Elizabethkingia meningoseptica]